MHDQDKEEAAPVNTVNFSFPEGARLSTDSIVGSEIQKESHVQTMFADALEDWNKLVAMAVADIEE